MEQLRQVRQTLALLEFADAGDALPTSGDYPESLRRRKEQLEIDVARRLPDLSRMLTHKAPNAATIAAALPSDATLIEYVRSPFWDFDAAPPRELKRRAAHHYGAFVLHAEAPDSTALIDLGEADVIDRHISLSRLSHSC